MRTPLIELSETLKATMALLELLEQKIEKKKKSYLFHYHLDFQVEWRWRWWRRLGGGEAGGEAGWVVLRFWVK